MELAELSVLAEGFMLLVKASEAVKEDESVATLI